MKPQDTKACQVHFGVELETVIPEISGLNVGHYHGGLPVQSGHSTYGTAVSAPSFAGSYWKAERDGSIRTLTGQRADEFISPILHGEQGVQALGEFVGFINQIGARVNDSCGCHITVSVDSITGSADANVRAEFARKLAHIAQWHTRATAGRPAQQHLPRQPR
jgi:hypothetical protein